MSKKYKVFGKIIEVSFLNNQSGNLLSEELSLYPEVETGKSSLIFNYCDRIETFKSGSRNPSIHHASNGDFIIKSMNCEVKFIFAAQQLVRVDFAIPAHKKRRFNKFVNRWMSMQFTSNEEAIGQIFHEQVLIPSLFFDPKLTLVHASGVVLKDGTSILLGGTGGIGKTSVEMALCLDQNAAFLTDDIAVVDVDGKAWPNLSLPKIYGYNIQANAVLKKKTLGGATGIRKLHWFLHHLRGASFVRERVIPNEFYGRAENNAVQLSKYYILKREFRDDINIQPVMLEDAAKMSNSIIWAEYDSFIRHLLWNEFNEYENNPFNGAHELMSRLESNFLKAFKDVACYVVKIPVEMPHELFKKEMVELLT